ncbi:putative serpin E3 [Menidia menidia]
MRELQQEGSAMRELQQVGAMRELQQEGSAMRELQQEGSATRELQQEGSAMQELQQEGSAMRELQQEGSAMRELQQVGAMRELQQEGSTMREMQQVGAMRELQREGGATGGAAATGDDMRELESGTMQQEGGAVRESQQAGGAMQRGGYMHQEGGAMQQEGSAMRERQQEGGAMREPQQQGNAMQEPQLEDGAMRESQQQGDAMRESQQDGGAMQQEGSAMREVQQGDAMQELQQDWGTMQLPHAMRQEGGAMREPQLEGSAMRELQQEGDATRELHQQGDAMQESQQDGGTMQHSGAIRQEGGAMRELHQRGGGAQHGGGGVRELQHRFALGLYRALARAQNGSRLAVSPLSVAAAVALLQLGARGNTRAQLEGALGYSVRDAPVQDLLLQAFQTHAGVSDSGGVGVSGGGVDGGVGGEGGVTGGVWLQQSCTLFVQSGVRLRAEFSRQAAAWGNASVASRGVTAGRPRGGGPRGPRGGGSRGPQGGGRRLQVVLVNTVAFRGVWQKQFVFSNTQNLPFLLPDGSSVKVPMMYQTAEVSFGHFRTAGARRYTVLELPYRGRTLSLQLVLPGDRRAPLASLENQLSPRQLAAWETGLRRTKMDIFLPRFRVQSRFSLRSALPALGISDAFSPTDADFSGICAQDGLFLSDAVHQVSIEVSEDGTQAAAATAMLLLKRSRFPVFKADRPFLFLLRQVDSGSILFMGRVLNPQNP